MGFFGLVINLAGGDSENHRKSLRGRCNENKRKK
jgi:hypothetical protein